MIITRYKALTNGGFRIYFDFYDTTTKKRKYKFTKLEVSKDYTKKNDSGKIPKFSAKDRTTHSEADEAKSKWLKELKTGTEKIANVKIGAIEYIEQFEEQHPHLKPVTVLLKTSLKEYEHDDIALRAINNAQWVKNFNAWLRIKRAYSTRKSILSVLKRILKVAVIDKLAIHIEMDYSFKVATKDKPEPDIKYLSESEVITLKKTPFNKNDHLKQAFLFSCGTGLRLSDLIRIKWSNIKDNKLTITPYKTRKKKKTVTIPLKKLALDALAVVGTTKSGDNIFWAMPRNRSYVRTCLIDWAKDADLKQQNGEDLNISMHSGRHTMAVLALNAGISVVALQKLLGHADLSTTLKYAKLLDSTAQEEMIDKFPDI